MAIYRAFGITGLHPDHPWQQRIADDIAARTAYPDEG